MQTIKLHNITNSSQKTFIIKQYFHFGYYGSVKPSDLNIPKQFQDMNTKKKY